MKIPIGNFISNAHKYTRNPLGIIALFITFIYAIAALVLGVTPSLDYSLKVPLVWFLIIFPVMILMVFSDLVANHHHKLYSPMDYRTDDGFLETMSPQDIIRKFESEVQEIPNKPDSTITNSKYDHIKNIILVEEQFVNLLAKSFTIDFRRNVRIPSIEGITEFDAIGISSGELVAVEVKYTSDGKISDSVIAMQVTRFMSLYSNLSKFQGANSFSAILGIVKEDNINIRIFPHERIEKLFSKLPYKLTVLEYKLSELQKKS